MEHYRVQQYLMRGQNIKCLNKNYEKIPSNQRFDNGLFDLLAADTSTQPPTILGVYIADDDEEAQRKIEQTSSWAHKHQARTIVITTQPHKYLTNKGIETILYQQTNGRHEFKTRQEETNNLQLTSGFYIKATDYLLGVAEKKSPLIKIARKLFTIYNQQR